MLPVLLDCLGFLKLFVVFSVTTSVSCFISSPDIFEICYSFQSNNPNVK